MDSISYVSWNVRGASNDTNRGNIRSLIQESRASLLCLQESKCQVWNERKIISLGMGGQSGWLEEPPQGQSGGLLTVWNKDHL